MRRWTTADLAIILSLGLVLVCLLHPIVAARIRIGAAAFLKGPLAISELLVSNIRDFLSHDKSANENRALRKANDELMGKLILMQEDVRELARLRELLKLKQALKFKTTACRVISRDISNYTQGLLIDKGANDEIKVGCGVIGIGGLLGRVVEAGRDVSRVLLLTDENMRVAAELIRLGDSAASGAQGVLWGQGSGLCVLKYVESNVDVKPGDMVVTSGASGLIPKGIALGEVSEVEEAKGAPFKLIYVSPSARLSQLEEALCILEPPVME